MKPRNFPGRKTQRRMRAGQAVPEYFGQRYIADIKLRIGWHNRDVWGLAIDRVSSYPYKTTP